MDKRAPLWRTLLTWLFLVLFCLAAPLALVSNWARLTLLDPQLYTQTVRTIAGDPRVQDAVAARLMERVETRLAGENPTASEAVRSRAVAGLLGEATARVLASAAFREAWETANRAAHQLLVAGLATGQGQPVTLDLSPLAQALGEEIDALDIETPPEFEIEPEDLQIEVIDAATADRMRTAADQLDRVAWGSIALTVLFLILTVGLASDRLAALVRASFGLSLAMIALIALMLVGQGWLASAAAEGGHAMVEAIVEAVSQGLRVLAVALALVGLLLAGLFTAARALRRDIPRRASET